MEKQKQDNLVHRIDTRGPLKNHNSPTHGPLVPSARVTWATDSRTQPNGSLPGEKYRLKIERKSDKDAEMDGGEDDVSSETIDEELKRPIYVTSPETGKKLMKMQFDVQGFQSSDIRVKISGKKLVIFALHRENDSGRKSTTEFCRRIRLPDDADLDRLECTFQSEILSIEAPILESADELEKVPTPAIGDDQPLNTPFLTQSDLGAVVNVHAEVGTIFKAEDVVVKLKGNKRLVVLAERQENEEEGKTTLSARLRREFELPATINPASLKAGLTHSGILNVSAIIVNET